MADPKDCHDNAARCIEMANEALDARMQAVLFEMANLWLKLAADSERDSAVRAHYREVRVGVEENRGAFVP